MTSIEKEVAEMASEALALWHQNGADPKKGVLRGFAVYVLRQHKYGEVPEEEFTQLLRAVMESVRTKRKSKAA